ncbi:MAG: glycosyltransferase [Candidatus Odinarchaeota archaeon]
MIFVTVGTSLPHDELVEMMDRLVGDGKIKDKVIVQRGAGKFAPKNIEHFRFSPSLDEYYNDAEIVISNCGAGTIMENTTKGRKLIVIQNPDITGGHEWELIKKMEEGEHLIWCKSIDNIVECIDRARSLNFKEFNPKRLKISELIREITTR